MRILRVILVIPLVTGLAVLGAAVPASAASPTGHKHITVKQTGSKVLVRWGATTDVKYYKVKVSTSPDMVQNAKSYTVSKNRTRAVVAPARYAGVSSGNYTFVRVYAHKKSGKVGLSPWKKIRLAPPSPDGGRTRLSVATFNVRTAAAKDAHPWSSRISRVASQITRSGASVVAVQEAGAKSESYTVVKTPSGNRKDFYWQYEQLDDALPRYRLVRATEYSANSRGKQSTRILYDPSRVTLLSESFFNPSKVDSLMQWIPYALFRDNATGARFYFVSVHLANNDSSASEQHWSALRGQQAKALAAKVRSLHAAGGHQVIVAGDLNSNEYTKPSNVADRVLLDAGFYDAYATRAVKNEFYATFNRFARPKASPARTDYIFTYGSLKGSYGYTNWIESTSSPSSDHYMQSAVVPIR